MEQDDVVEVYCEQTTNARKSCKCVFFGETNSFEFGFSAPSGGDRILVFHENEEKKRSVQLSWEGRGGKLL